jgi:hypothetical protein
MMRKFPIHEGEGEGEASHSLTTRMFSTLQRDVASKICISVPYAPLGAIV